MFTEVSLVADLPRPPFTGSRQAVVLYLISLVVLGTSGIVEAEEWQFIGSRYQAMGGAGVAVADESLALYWNPGALAFAKGHDVQLPFGVSVSAEGDVMREIDELDAFVEGLTDVRDKVRNGDPLTPSDKDALLQLVGRNIPLFREDDEGFVVQANAGLTARSGRFALGLFGYGESVIAPFIDNVSLGLSGAPTAEMRIADFVGSGADRSGVLTPEGQLLADAIADDFRAFTNTGLEQNQAEEFVFLAESAGLSTREYSVRNGLRRSARATAQSPGAIISDNVTGAAAVSLVTAETSLSYGHPLFDKIGIGGTLRYIYANTFVDYTTLYEVESVRELIKETLEFNNRQDTHGFGIDLGLLAKPTDWLRIGIVARNLNEPDFKVDMDPALRRALGDAGIRIKRFRQKRQVRLGVALDLFPWWTLASDIDLTNNSNDYIPGFDSRLFSVGSEMRLSYRRVSLALRAGAFMNVANDQNRAPTLTGGIGLQFWNFTLGVSGAVSTERDRFESIGSNDRIPVRAGFAGQLGYRAEF